MHAQEQNAYTEQRARLATIFPRGRFALDVDGTAILTSRNDPGAHVFEVVGGGCPSPSRCRTTSPWTARR